MRQEVALAKAEVKDSATKAGKGAGMLGAAGYAGHLFVLFLSIPLALVVGLPDLMVLAWAGIAARRARLAGAAQ